LRGQIVRGADGQRSASLTQTDLGRHLPRRKRTRRSRPEIEIEMAKILEDWMIDRTRGTQQTRG